MPSNKTKGDLHRKIQNLGFRLSISGGRSEGVFDVEAYKGNIVLKAEHPNLKKCLSTILKKAVKQDPVEQAIRKAIKLPRPVFKFFTHTYLPCHLTLDIDEVLPLLESPKCFQIKELYGYSLKLNTKKLKIFKEKGLQCVSCGLYGEFFEINSHENSYCLNLYCRTEFKKIMFTIDHIIPRARGGGNNKGNLQVMCEPCNNFKGDSI